MDPMKEKAIAVIATLDTKGPEAAFVKSQIEAAGDKQEIFTGTCGAESGGVPVTGISPALFVKQIELQKKHKSQQLPIILPRPDKIEQNNAK